MIDLDHFKQINDFHGHQTGDHLLKECALRIRSLLPTGGLLARLGGDEFACVVAFDPAHEERVDRLAAAIAEALDRSFAIDGFTGKVSASIGVTRSDRPNRLGTARRTRPRCSTWPTSPCIRPRSRAAAATCGSRIRWKANCVTAPSWKRASGRG
jgi:hypothetical protein